MGCFVTGDGCSSTENKALHLPASRMAMTFNGPTRRSGKLDQSSDLSLISKSFGFNGDKYAAMKSFSQFNIDQELQLFFKEIVSLEMKDKDGKRVSGKVRVAAFLPTYIKELDSMKNADDYDENAAVAIYDYNIVMNS